MRTTAGRAGRKKGEQEDKEHRGCQSSQRVGGRGVRENTRRRQLCDKTKARFAV